MCCIGEYKIYARLHTHTHALFHFQHNSINTYYDRRTQHRRRPHPQSHIKMTLLLCHQPSPHTASHVNFHAQVSRDNLYERNKSAAPLKQKGYTHNMMVVAHHAAKIIYSNQLSTLIFMNLFIIILYAGVRKKHPPRRSKSAPASMHNNA